MQGRQVFSNMTVRENLEIGAFSIKDKELNQRNLDYVFEKFPFLKEKEGEHASNLSGGQQQMLSIAKALMQDPELLLLDEPSLGLSPKTMNEVFDKILQINKEGVTIIIVEQNVKQALKIATKTFTIEMGRIII